MEGTIIHTEHGVAGSILLAAYALAVNFSSLPSFDSAILVPVMHVTAILAAACSVIIAIRTLFFNKNQKQ